MKRSFVTVDVFTEQRFGGNPLAVVLDAEGLDTSDMQNLAMEFNLAETAFVMPPEDPAHRASVRIFTPRTEVPFAGHPNIGTAFVLASRDGLTSTGKSTMVFEEKAGLVEIEILEKASTVAGARLAAPQVWSLGGQFSPEGVARACSLDVSDIATTRHSPVVASCGLPFVIAEVKTRRALAKARPRHDIFEELSSHSSDEKVAGIHLYVSVDTAVDIEARMFAPLFGVTEDPATGSANVALIGLLASLSPEPDVRLERKISQGVDLGRPSLLFAEAEKRGGEVVSTRIGGSCVPMMEGSFDM